MTHFSEYRKNGYCLRLFAAIRTLCLVCTFVNPMQQCLHLFIWTHFLAFMEWADDGGNRPAAWSYVLIQSYSCSLRVFYRTLAVGKDTY